MVGTKVATLSCFDRRRIRARARDVARIGSLMLSVARVTRNIEKCGTTGTFLNFVRFVRGEFMAGSRCCRVPRGESRKVYGGEEKRQKERGFLLCGQKLLPPT